MQDHNILIIGGSGFIGTHLIQELQKQNFYNITCVSRFLPVHTINQVDYYDQVDITQPHTLEPFIKKAKIVINLAGLISFYKKDTSSLSAINEKGVLNILEICEKAQIKKFIHLSSSASFGFSEKEIDENSNDFNWEKYKHYLPYSYSKHLANQAIHKSSIPTNIIFPALVLGPGDQNNVPRIFEYIKNKNLFFAPSGGNAVIDVRDLAKIIVATLQKSANKENYIACSQNISFYDLFTEASCITGQKSIVKKIPKLLGTLIFFFVRGLEIFRFPISAENIFLGFQKRKFSNKKIKKYLEFESEYDITKTLQDSWNSVSQNQDRYLVIYNKHSGRIKFRDHGKMIKDLLQKNNIYYFFLDLEMNSTLSNLQLEEVIKSEKINKILVAGGDGTLRRVVEYFYHKNIYLPIAFFPTGSTGLFAKVFNISYRSPRKLKKLLTAKIKKVPLATLNKEHVFLIATCYGDLAKPTTKANNYLKKLFGFVAYIIAALKHNYYFQSKTTTIMIDNTIRKVYLNSAMVFLTDSITKYINIEVDEKKNFQVVLIKNKNILGFISALFSLYFKKKHSHFIKIISADQVEITTHFTEDIHIDGDSFRDGKQKHSFDISSKKIKILM